MRQGRDKDRKKEREREGDREYSGFDDNQHQTDDCLDAIKQFRNVLSILLCYTLSCICLQRSCSMALIIGLVGNRAMACKNNITHEMQASTYSVELNIRPIYIEKTSHTPNTKTYETMEQWQKKAKKMLLRKQNKESVRKTPQIVVHVRISPSAIRGHANDRKPTVISKIKSFHLFG